MPLKCYLYWFLPQVQSIMNLFSRKHLSRGKGLIWLFSAYTKSRQHFSTPIALDDVKFIAIFYKWSGNFFLRREIFIHSKVSNLIWAEFCSPASVRGEMGIMEGLTNTTSLPYGGVLLDLGGGREREKANLLLLQMILRCFEIDDICLYEFS